MLIEPLETRTLLSITTLYWDPRGSAGLGGSGTWDTSTANWSINSTGGGTLRAWANGDKAVFNGTAATVSLASGTISAASIQFIAGGYTISSNTLTLPSGGTSIDVYPGQTATISAVITGSYALTKTDSGILSLTGTNNYTGGTTISSGTLQVSSAGNLGSGALSIGAGVLDATAGFTWTPSISLIGATTIKVDSGSLIASGTVSGSGSLTVSGGGTLTLTGTNTYAGGTTIAVGATLQLGNGSPAGTVVGAIVDNGTLTLSVGDSEPSIGNTISGSGGLTVNDSGGGQLILSATNNSYLGSTTINGGELYIDPGALPSGTSVIMGTTGTPALALNASQTIAGLSGGGSVGAVFLNNSSQLTLNTPSGFAGVFSGVISDSGGMPAVMTQGDPNGVIDNASSGGSLVVSGVGTQALTNANTYSGGTTISGGAEGWRRQQPG